MFKVVTFIEEYNLKIKLTYHGEAVGYVVHALELTWQWLHQHPHENHYLHHLVDEDLNVKSQLVRG
jgi:hypothetical protein